MVKGVECKINLIKKKQPQNYKSYVTYKLEPRVTYTYSTTRSPPLNHKLIGSQYKPKLHLQKEKEMERAHPATISIVMTKNNWGLHVESGLLTKMHKMRVRNFFLKAGDELLNKLALAQAL
jgi:hypothetical protein